VYRKQAFYKTLIRSQDYVRKAHTVHIGCSTIILTQAFGRK
jgi:hypothetical protein